MNELRGLNVSRSKRSPEGGGPAMRSGVGLGIAQQAAGDTRVPDPAGSVLAEVELKAEDRVDEVSRTRAKQRHRGRVLRVDREIERFALLQPRCAERVRRAVPVAPDSTSVDFSVPSSAARIRATSGSCSV